MRNEYKNYTVVFKDGTIFNSRARTRDEAVSKVRKKNKKTLVVLKGVTIQ
jgi:hypothetical protein